MEKKYGCYSCYGNPINRNLSRKADRWKSMLARKFSYDPKEQYYLHTVDNPQLGSIFGLKEIVRGGEGEKLNPENAVIISTVRMGFGHYRIAMAGASASYAMGFTPYWLDMLNIPGITTDVINWCNTWYSRFSRISQRSRLFDKYIWESVTTGDSTLPILDQFLNWWIVGWPWRFLKTQIKDYKMSELFKNLHEALPPEMPILTAHMWNAMGAVSGGMTNVVDMMFDNWPMSFQLTEGAKHGVQSPSGYYGFRTMRGCDEKNRVLNPVPSDAIYYTGHHIDHELVENIETDCTDRLERMNRKEPRRFLLTMGGAGAQRDLFSAIINHCLPLIRQDKLTLIVNLGDHEDNWIWLKKQLTDFEDLITTHFTWPDTQDFADRIRSGSATGLHICLFDNIFHAVYSTNYLMRVVDVLITKPSELAFYPVPKLFNSRVGGHEKWGAIRGAELGDSTIESRTIPQTLQAIDLLTREDDLLTMYCDRIVMNKKIGIYDGAYKCVELATGRKFSRPI
jgi:hypothetical protein